QRRDLGRRARAADREGLLQPVVGQRSPRGRGCHAGIRPGGETRAAWADTVLGPMQVGLIGSGNMARGLARGWGEPVLCTDVRGPVAQALADELGGEVVATNAELAQRADVVVLCHKPAQLAEVAAEVAPHAKAVASILGAVSLADLKAAYPDRPVY